MSTILQETKRRLQCCIQIPSQLIPLSLVVLLGASDSQIRSPLSISTGPSYRHLTLDLFKSSFHTQLISSVLSSGSQLGVVLDLTFPHLPLHSLFLLVLSTTLKTELESHHCKWLSLPPLSLAPLFSYLEVGRISPSSPIPLSSLFIGSQ